MSALVARHKDTVNPYVSQVIHRPEVKQNPFVVPVLRNQNLPPVPDTGMKGEIVNPATDALKRKRHQNFPGF